MVNRITICLSCFCASAISAVFWQKLPSTHSLALMIAILVTSLFIIFLFSKTKLTEHYALPEVTLCWAVSGLLSGILWVASVGHFYYAWQLPEGKIQQDVIISGRVLSGGCVAGVIGGQEAAYQYVVVIESINSESTATYLDDQVFSSLFRRVLTSTFNFRARLTHQRYKFANSQGLTNKTISFSQHGSMDVKHQSVSNLPIEVNKLECLHNGDSFIAIAKLKPAYSTANPLGVSRQQQLVSQFIHATGYIKSIDYDKTKHNHSLRYALASTLQQLDLMHRAWWRALLLGDKTDFTLDDWTLLQRTGTGHIFSISGMHLSLIAGVCLLLFNPVIFILAHATSALSKVKLCFVPFISFLYPSTVKKGREQRIRKTTKNYAPIRAMVLCVLIAACTCYALLSGGALPVVRALILITVGCVLSLSKRAWRPVNIALTMLTLSLLLFPLSMLGASFYLSVGAVVCIWFLVVVWGLQRAPWYVSLVKLQIALTIVMMPLTLIWFGSASFIAIVANLIALPVITLLLPICLVSLLMLHFVALGFVREISAVLIHYSDVCLGYLLLFLNALNELPLSAVDFHVNSGTAVCLVSACVIFLLPAWRYKRVCVMLLLVPLLFNIQKWLPGAEKQWELHVFDAGQASAIAVTKGDRAIIVDSGAQFNGNAYTATKHVLPFLVSKHISSIDVVIHTHNDNDHAGGENAVKQHPLAAQATFYTPTSGCERGKRIRWQNLTIHFLWPPRGNVMNNNAMSCVVKITSGSGSVLIPGDIEKASEYALVTLQVNDYSSWLGTLPNASYSNMLNVPTLAADILIAPHHGSKTSSTNVFIERVAPKAVIYTQGFENRWQFPARVVTKRYERLDITQYLTSYHGYIGATFDKDSFYIDAQRTTLRKRWYLPGIMPRHLKD